MRNFLFRRHNPFLPKLFPIVARETDQGAAVLLFDGLSNENSVAPYDGGGVATFGQGCPPTDVLVGAPVQGQVFFFGNPVAVRSAPARPGEGLDSGGE